MDNAKIKNLISNKELLDSALHEAAKILVCAYGLLDVPDNTKVSASLSSNGKNYKIAFEQLEG